MKLRAGYLIVIVISLILASSSFSQSKSGAVVRKDDTETVYTTFYVIPGKEAEFWKVLEKAWPTYYRHGMVLKSPHLILNGTNDDGKPYFIEILTWKDHDTPDNAPAEVKTIWEQMTALCEKRDGHRRIEFYEVKLVKAGTAR